MFYNYSLVLLNEHGFLVVLWSLSTNICMCSLTKEKRPPTCRFLQSYYFFSAKILQRAFYNSSHHPLTTPRRQSDFCPQHCTGTPFPKVTSVFLIAKSNTMLLSVLIPEITVALNTYLTSLTLAHFFFFFWSLRELVHSHGFTFEQQEWMERTLISGRY